MDPASVMLGLTDENKRTLFQTQGYLTLEQILDARPTTIEARGLRTLLVSWGWKQRTKHRFEPPKDHPLRLAPETDGNGDPAEIALVRRLVGASSIPADQQAAAVHYILYDPNRRLWNLTAPNIRSMIHRFKKRNATQPVESPDDTSMRVDLEQYLNDPDTKELVASRPQRYLTTYEILEGIYGPITPGIADLKRLARVMPWTKRGSKYMQPNATPDLIVAPPRLDTLDEYLTDRYCVMEYDILLHVSGIGAKHIRTSDRNVLYTAMRTRNWRRRRSLYESRRGWCYERT